MVFTLNIHLTFLLAAIAISISRVILELLFVDPRKLRSYSERVKRWRQKAREALRSRDPKLIARVQREKKVIDSLMLEMTKMRYKSIVILMIISLTIFWFIILPQIRGEPIYIPPLSYYLGRLWYFVMISITVNAFSSIFLKYKGYE